jgi:hypothetical protein
MAAVFGPIDDSGILSTIEDYAVVAHQQHQGSCHRRLTVGVEKAMVALRDADTWLVRCR